MTELEHDTDAIAEEKLSEYCGKATTCNGWSFHYIENVNENAVVKDIFVESAQQAHCVVYDPDLDVTIDPTLGQFNDLPAAGAWDGDQHPYHSEHEDSFEWDDRAEFEEHYSEHPNGPYIV